MHLIVDAMNVIGSRPDGWWRDRSGAIEGLAAALVRRLPGWVGEEEVTVVTSDRRLTARVRGMGADVEPARSFRCLLGC